MTIKRANGKCKGCSKVASRAIHTACVPSGSIGYFIGEKYIGMVGCEAPIGNIIVRCACGHKVKVNPVRPSGKVPAGAEHKCDARCVNAQNTVCDCACKGEFHGASH